MADEDRKDDDGRSLGQVLMENLAKALVEQTRVTGELVAEMKLLREQMEVQEEMGVDLLSNLGTGLRIIHDLAEIGEKRRPHWGDVADILTQIKSEGEEEEEGEGDGEGGGDGEPPVRPLPIPVPPPATSQEVLPPKS